MEHLRTYTAWRAAESAAREAADNFAAAIRAGRHPSEREMGELSRLRTSASEALQRMIEQAQTLPRHSTRD
ncbi:hypothetical protein GCM10007320_36540 [Pseudorhodoferax aquiterrae]|uniref:Uncharacterized protein n=1 Tax=Pseudorhodoferax aquiterrae TaxID=747304 RepID=A0ABQ3G5A1_9BURK|nr:hypothetical protein [Pseudorhodoferax aquiterrae]GHC89162.1 hypothetical protein GCM10007320_36540 [Pseudorhodoferax aquiterrae]